VNGGHGATRAIEQRCQRSDPFSSEACIRGARCALCTSTHCNAAISSSQRRQVIDSVANHHDRPWQVDAMHKSKSVLRGKLSVRVSLGRARPFGKPKQHTGADWSAADLQQDNRHDGGPALSAPVFRDQDLRMGVGTSEYRVLGDRIDSAIQVRALDAYSCILASSIV